MSANGKQKEKRLTGQIKHLKTKKGDKKPNVVGASTEQRTPPPV